MALRTGNDRHAQAGESITAGSADGQDVVSRPVIRVTEPEPYAAVCPGNDNEPCFLRHACGLAVCCLPLRRHAK